MSTTRLMCATLTLALAILALQPASVFADEAPTPIEKPVSVTKTEPRPAKIAVKMDSKAVETHIQISRKALARLMDAQQNTVKKDTGFLTSPDHTIVAGLAMTVALVLGGLFAFRKGSRTVLRPAVILAVVGVTLASSIALADKAPTAPKNPARNGLAENATLTAVEIDTVGFTVDSKVLVDLKFNRATGEK